MIMAFGFGQIIPALDHSIHVRCGDNGLKRSYISIAVRFDAELQGDHIIFLLQCKKTFTNLCGIGRIGKEYQGQFA